MTQLPRGRHNLSRDDVRAQQRGRILAALTTTMAGSGYADTPVSAILRVAGVSRETFYELFTSKADCFAAALGETIGTLTEVIEAAVPTRRGAAAPDVLSDMVAAYLAALDAEPALARLFLVETYAAGPDAMRARLAMQRRIADRIAALFALDASGRERSEAFVGTVVALVTAQVVDPSLGTVRALHPVLVDVARRLLS